MSAPTSLWGDEFDADGGTTSLGPACKPITRPVFVWLEIAAQLAHHGKGGLATAIQEAMDGRRLGDYATFTLTVDEQLRVNAVLQGCSVNRIRTDLGRPVGVVNGKATTTHA